MTKIADLKGRKAIPQSTSLGISIPPVSDNQIMNWINSVNMEWGKTVFTRMDEDEKLWTGEPFKLTDPDGNDMEAVEHVTLNDARVYGERVLAVLNESEEVIEINGQRNGKELDGHQSNVIEDWWSDITYLANEHLNEILLPDMDTYLWEQISIRGRVGARILLSQDRNGFDIDLLPVDMRKCIYGLGRRGLSRVGFWDTLDRDMCREEYPDYRPQGEAVTRWDYWDDIEEIVFLDNKFYEAIPNKLGHPPFVIQLCQQGTFLDTSTRALRMRGDSIFSANRDLYPHLNKIASILQSMNMLSLRPPRQLTSESGTKLPSEPVDRLGNTVALKINEDLTRLEQPDILGAGRFFMAELTGALQRGSISNIDWGNLQFQLSQVAIATLAGASKQVFTPRLKTMERFKRLLFKEALWQFRIANLTADIGRTGSKRIYTKADLEGNYTVDFEYLASLPEETAATYGLASMAARWMDDRSIRKTILKYRDYDDIDEKYLVQTAQKVSQALALFQMAQALDKQGKIDEAKVLLIQMGQSLQGITPQEVTKITGVETPQPSPQQEAQALQIGPGAPPVGQTRTTRKMEPPGAGEILPQSAVGG
jgi:hypothetical protein